jgi:hypothetical protein
MPLMTAALCVDCPRPCAQQRDLRFPRPSTLEVGRGLAIDRFRSAPRTREFGTSRKDVKPAWSMAGGLRSWTAPSTFANDSLGARVMSSRRSVASYLEKPKTLPAFVHVDKVQLRFRMWFRDDLALLTGPDRTIIHNCILTYYLIDDSISVMEPRQENSGLNQGLILRRQRVQRPDGSGVYTWRDFTVGAEVVLRGQTCHLVDTDEYTRNWYGEQGIELGEPLQPPLDPNEVRERNERKKRKDFEMAKQRRVQADLMRVEEVKHRFLNYDRKVLRFYGIWDDRKSIFGQRHYVTLRYYLFDFTLDMQEFEGGPAGHKSRFLVRQRIPKKFHHLDDMQDENPAHFIGIEDLFVGATVNVFGKEIILYDCDEHTRRYIQQTTGRTMPKIDISEPTVPIPRLPTPPSNGIGLEEDTLQNAKLLLPKPVYRDMAKYKKYAGKVMRFTARWDSEKPEENCRSFIVSFYPADDAVAVFETSGDGRNTGMTSGKFLERTKLTKPGSRGSRLQYYKQADFVVGATIVAFSRKFVLTGMDKFTARLMDIAGDEAAAIGDSDAHGSAAERLAANLKDEDRTAMMEAFLVADRHKSGTIPLEAAMEILAPYLHGVADTEVMELVDLGRAGPRDFSGEVHYERLFNRIFSAAAGAQPAPSPPLPARPPTGGVRPPTGGSAQGPAQPALPTPLLRPASRGESAGLQRPRQEASVQFADDGEDSRWQVGALDDGDYADDAGPVAYPVSEQWDGEANVWRPPQSRGTSAGAAGGIAQGLRMPGGRCAGEEALAVDEDGGEIEWASGNNYFDN